MADKYEIKDGELDKATGGEGMHLVFPDIERSKTMKKILEIKKKQNGKALSDDDLENAAGGTPEAIEKKKKQLEELIHVQTSVTFADDEHGYNPEDAKKNMKV